MRSGTADTAITRALIGDANLVVQWAIGGQELAKERHKANDEVTVESRSLKVLRRVR